MSTLLLPAERLPVFETIQYWEYFESGILNARRSNRARRKKSESDDHPVTKRTDFDDYKPPTPPIQSATGDEPVPRWELRIRKPVYRETMGYFSDRTPEAAGILFGSQGDDSLIDEFVPDETGRGTPVSFDLGTLNLNRVVKVKKAEGKSCMGIAHSHPAGVTQPSCGDLFYFRKLFAVPANGDAQHLFVPIICGDWMYPYVFAHNEIHPAKLVLV